MPVRNFRYIQGTEKTTSLSDGSGIAELYDIYSSRVLNNLGYPHTISVTSSLDSISSFIEGQQFGATFTLNGYYVQETWELDLTSYSTAWFQDYTASTIQLAPNTATGQQTLTFPSNSFSLASGITSAPSGSSFIIQLIGSISGTVYSKSFNITEGTYSLSFNSNSYNEGSATACTFTYSNAPPSTTMYYAFTPYSGTQGTVASADLSTTVTGSFTSSATGSGTYNISGPTIIEDYLTESSETLQARVCHYSVTKVSNWPVAIADVTINDTSQTPSAAVVASTTSLNEGSSVTFSINMTNFTSGTLNWDIVLSADMETADINTNSGTVSISGGTGSVVITATSDGLTETGQSETFYLVVRHPSGSGASIGQSPTVTINDTSTGTPETSAVITQNGNLTAHWDFSLLSPSVGTTYTSSGTTIPNTSGLSIGSASSTPSMVYYTTSSSYEVKVGTFPNTSLKSLHRPDSTSSGGASVYGAPAWPDILNSSTPLTFAVVLMPTSVRNGWNRPITMAWDGVGGYSGAVVFQNSGSTSGNYRYVNTGTSTSTSGYYTPGFPGSFSSNNLFIYTWAIQGKSVRYAHKRGSASTASGSGTASGTRYYGSENSGNRRTYAFESGYWNGNYAGHIGEMAVWNEYWTTSDLVTLVNDLYNKWS